LRSEVLKLLEALRAAGSIGSSLAGEVDLYAEGEALRGLQALGSDLRFVLITSRADVHVAPAPADVKVTPSQEMPGVWIRVTPTARSKCERCWHYRADVGADPAHPQICARCVANLYGAGEPRSRA